MVEHEELESVLAELGNHALLAVKITPHREKPETLWSSKFGGQPYWPQGMAYPHSSRGEPLHLLAQLNFAQMPILPGYPTRGLLQFFIADDELYGLDHKRSLAEVLADPDGYRVIYHPEINTNQAGLATELLLPPLSHGLPTQGEYALTFSLMQDLPAPSDYRFERIARNIEAIDENMVDALYDRDIGTGSKLGGYAYFTQDDPRPSEKTGEEWVLLFQMDTADDDDGVSIMWGDCGVGNFFIQSHALAKLDFSRVWYHWDCC